MGKNNYMVIYHAGCMDGFCAAWVARKSLMVRGIVPEYHYAQYGDDPPDVTGKHVYVLDFSYPREQLIAMEAAAMSLTVLDHHETARDALEDLPFATFDLEHSGARMTWDHFHADNKRPWMVDYIEDRDLWKWKLKDSKAVNAHLRSSLSINLNSFDDWDEMAKADAEDAALLGHIILEEHDKLVGVMANKAVKYRFEGLQIPVAAVSCLVSEVGERLCEGAPFSLTYFQVPSDKPWPKYVFNLRSRGDYHVGKLAKRFGGGGHQGAAGFTTAKAPHEWLREQEDKWPIRRMHRDAIASGFDDTTVDEDEFGVIVRCSKCRLTFTGLTPHHSAACPNIVESNDGEG